MKRVVAALRSAWCAEAQREGLTDYDARLAARLLRRRHAVQSGESDLAAGDADLYHPSPDAFFKDFENLEDLIGELAEAGFLARPALRAALSSDATALLRPALGALAQLGDPLAVPALQRVATHVSAAVREDVSRALARSGRLEAQPVLEQLARDSDNGVAAAARRELSALPAEIARQLDRQRAIADPDSGVRSQAMRGVAKQGDCAAIPTMIAGLADSQWGVAFYASQGLRRQRALAFDEVLEALLAHGRGKGRYLREFALEVLASCSDARATAAVTKSLKSDSKVVRAAAAKTLDRLSDRRAVPSPKRLQPKPKGGARRRGQRTDRSRMSPTTKTAGYSGTPLPQKLGIKPGMKVALLGAPGDFETTLGALPEGATLVRNARGAAPLVLWFVDTLKTLDTGMGRRAAAVQPGDGLWICWRKRTADPTATFGENEVRKAGLAHGIVDYKICAVDATWSGLKFARRAK